LLELTQSSGSTLDFLSGGGEMGARMRDLDWTKTPLGDPSRWPQSLRTIVRVMLDSRYAMWMLWGPELTFFCNDAYLPTVGIKREWVLGARSDKVWEEIWPDIGPRIQNVLEHGQATWDEGLLLFLERSGFAEETYHTFSYSPVYDDLSRIAGMLCVVTEVTQRVIGERRLRALRDLAARGTGVETVQQACDRLMGVLRGNAFDVPFACLYLLEEGAEGARLGACTAEIPPLFRPSRLEAASPEPWPLGRLMARNEALIVPLPSGPESIPSPFRASPVASAMVLPVQGQGSSTCVAVLVAGISPRRALDEDYRGFFQLIAGQFSAALGDAQAYEAERRRAEALAKIDEAKTAFFSNVSHEFRTPLTLMLGPLEAAAAHPDTPPWVREQLALAQRNASRLLKLVNSLLDFSRIEAGRVQASFEPTDAAAFTTDLASSFRSAIEAAGLAFRVECDPIGEPLFLDREMWEKIVLNLLSNAFKFTFFGEIAVRLQRDGAWVSLEITDTGVGIPHEEIPRLFERFYRVETTQGRTQEGSGIGLALVQELVKLHGGRIEAASELGRGSRFGIHLPLGAAHLPPDRVKAPRALASTATGALAYVQEALRWIPEGQSARTHLTALDATPLTLAERGVTAGARIIVADDNADMRAYLAQLLGVVYRVEVVADGEAALAAVRRERPDLILSDIMMPRLDGSGLLKALRADESLRSIPLILLSARAGEEARIEGLQSGADEYLAKPFSARELTARIAGLLELARVRREADAVVRESEERLRLALDAAAMGTFVWLIDEGERRHDASMLALFGLPPGAALNFEQGASSLIHPEDAERYAQGVAHALEPDSGGVLREDVRVRLPEGSYRWLSITGQVYFEGRPPRATRMAGVAIDISSRKQVEQALRGQTLQYEGLLNGAPLGVFLVGGNFRIRQVNPLARPVFSDVPHLTSRDFGEVLRLVLEKDSADEIERAFRRTLETGERYVAREHAEQRLTRGAVEYYEWEIQRIPLPDGGYGVVCYFRNISAHVNARIRLEAADRQKNEFLAMLAHELRNPLAPIRNAGELLVRMASPDPQARAVTQMLQRQATVLARLVEDLLDVSRITQGRIVLKRQTLKLADVVAQAMETVEPMIQERRHKISVMSHEPLRVNADATRLVQCVVNLLNNAAKYTQPGGEIRVESCAESGEAVLAISDNGPGISADLLPQIFDLFVQSERTLDRAQGGLGIGLSLVKRLIEMHDGRVTASSAGPGRGAMFVIRLPLVKHDEEQVREAAVSASSARILVVDDNADAADSLKLLLQLDGHRVEAALSSAEALERVRSFKPEIVLLDIGLPDMDGYEVARRIRAVPEHARVQLIALTGYGQAEDKERAKASGFDDHLIKPVDYSALQQALKRP
jgi:PAS domain S-box-containing protein